MKGLINSDKNNGVHYMKTNIYFWLSVAEFFLEWKSFRKKFLNKITTHILCSVSSVFRKSCLYEIRWKNIVEGGRPQIKKWRMLIAFWALPSGVNPFAVNKYIDIDINLMNGAVFEYEMCVLIFSIIFVRNISHSNKNWAWYHKYTSVFMRSARYSFRI